MMLHKIEQLVLGLTLLCFLPSLAMEKPSFSHEATKRLLDASNKGNLEEAKLALEDNADIHARNNNGEQPIHLAAHRGSLPLVQLLFDRGAPTLTHEL